jgi:hypothetical protein
MLFQFLITIERSPYIKILKIAFKIPHINFLHIFNHCCDFSPTLQTFLMLDRTSLEMRNKIFIDELYSEVCEFFKSDCHEL